MKTIKGKCRQQLQFASLDELVAADNPVRILDAFVEKLDLKQLAEVRAMSEEWRMDYNTERPHKSLKYLSPLAYLQKQQVALFSPASENHSSIEAQPVVDKAENTEKKIIFETSN